MYDTAKLVNDQALPTSIADMSASFDAIGAALSGSSRAIFTDLKTCLHTLDTQKSRLADDNEACVRVRARLDRLDLTCAERSVSVALSLALQRGR